MIYAIIHLNQSTTITVYSPRCFITADKILISIHRIATIIWVIKIIRIAGTISSKQNCLRCESLQRVGINLSRKALTLRRFSGFFLPMQTKKGGGDFSPRRQKPFTFSYIFGEWSGCKAIPRRKGPARSGTGTAGTNRRSVAERYRSAEAKP